MRGLKVKLSPHHATGRRVAHEHTSYALLGFLVLLATVGLFVVTLGALAEPPPPKSSSYNVLAVVPGPRPSLPVVITSPTNGQRFSTSLISVAGRCQSGYLVKVFNNGLEAGGVFCSSRGNFELQIQLFAGQNVLTAAAYDALQQSGPVGPGVTVYYEPGQVASGRGGSDLGFMIKSTNNFEGYRVGQTVTRQLELIGGRPPYAVKVDWGDGSEPDLISRSQPGVFTVEHVYRQPGTGPEHSFAVIINARDVDGRQAFLQLGLVVSGGLPLEQPGAAPERNRLLIAWPLLLLMIFMLLAFWIGEHRAKRQLAQSPAVGV